MKKILKKVEKTIKKYKLFDTHDRILVAFSGGYDSVCLALVLKELGYEISLAHVNHNLRENAKNDEKFCKDFSEKFGFDLHISSPCVSIFAKEEKISLETAGRILRYEFLSSLGYDKIATAHHKNDCAETVIQHLIRGSGLKGLTGILPKRKNVVRPLIELSRNEIEEYVNSFGITPCVDESNFSEDYSRNRVRINILPLLEKENPKAVDNICKTASLLQADDDYLTLVAKKYVDGTKIKVEDLRNLPFPISSRALMTAYTNAAGTSKDFEFKHIEFILNNLKNHGEIIDLCFDVKVFARYGVLYFSKPAENNEFCYKLNMGENIFPNQNLKITLSLCNEKPKNGIYLNSDELGNSEIFLRSPKKDDIFVPFGSVGGKSLNKVFIDLKIPKEQRKSYPVIATESNIIQIVGKKRSAFYACDEHTKNFLKIEEEYLDEE